MDDRTKLSMETPESEAPAGGLLAALKPAQGPPGLQAAWARAAGTGLSLLKLRHASRRLGFSFQSVPAYLAGLAEAADAPLETALDWAGLTLDDPPGPAFTRAWGRLARALDLELGAALWHLRLSFAEQEGP